jgi:hypothetical protein
MSKKPYFDINTEKAIIAYNKSTDLAEREILFRKFIYQSFNKLAENLINTKKAYYMSDSVEESKYEVVTYLLEKLKKYDETKGKAFSYFTVVAGNYIIIQNKIAYNDRKTKMSIETAEMDIDMDESLFTYHEYDMPENVTTSFYNIYVEYLDRQLDNLFPKSRDNKIANAVLLIMKNRDHADNNKKILYAIIREIVPDAKTQQITRLINKMKSLYDIIFDIYTSGGKIDYNTNYTYMAD